MSNEEILLEILDKVNLTEDSFMDSLIRGQMTKAGISLGVTLLVSLIVINLFIRFNKEFNIIENIAEAFKMLKPNAFGKDSRFGEDEKKEEKRRPGYYDDNDVTFQDIIDSLHNFFSSTKLSKYIISIIIAWIELGWVMKFITLTVSNTILLINCFIAPQKVFIDYLVSVFK